MSYNPFSKDELLFVMLFIAQDFLKMVGRLREHHGCQLLSLIGIAPGDSVGQLFMQRLALFG